MTVKVAVVAPAGTVTLAGTVAADVLLLDRVITAPAGGAGPFNCSVPVTGVPAGTFLGLRDKEVSAAGLTVSVALRVPL